MEEKEKKKTTFEKYIQPVLKYIGSIGACLMVIAYIICVVILVEGFQQHELKGDIIFAVINALMGLVIMQFLKIQGISFAKNLEENKAVISEYYNTNTKDKKTRSIKFYWLNSVLIDILTKGITVAITTVGIIYIVIEGSKDYILFLLAAVNLIMFLCFGLLSLNSAYEFYNNRHIPFMKEKIKERKEIKECSFIKEKNLETCKSKLKKTKKIYQASLSKKQCSTNSELK